VFLSGRKDPPRNRRSVDPELNTYITVTAETARSRAHELGAEVMRRFLRGIP
jgi:hypothetical protein